MPEGHANPLSVLGRYPGKYLIYTLRIQKQILMSDPKANSYELPWQISYLYLEDPKANSYEFE
ncbi:MAG: hypothetical protein ACYCZ1_03610 [Candidatus Humimicrobiaceae bacterium]